MKGRLREEKGKTTVELRGRRKRCSPYLREKNKTHGYLPRFIGMSGVGEAVARVVSASTAAEAQPDAFFSSVYKKYKMEKGEGGWVGNLIPPLKIDVNVSEKLIYTTLYTSTMETFPNLKVSLANKNPISAFVSHFQ